MTRRATPSRSFAAACRHLFRHLDEPAELRRNPLVARYFARELKGVNRIRSDAAAASTLRDAIRRHAEAFLKTDELEDDERAGLRFAIVLADLEGTPRSVLTKKLGLSPRQYTRLQHEARHRIALALRAEAARGRWAATSSQGVESPLPEVAELASRGRTAEALTKLSRIIDQAGDTVAASALCLQATIRQRYLEDVEGAKRALAASRLRLQSVSANDTDAVTTVNAEIELGFVELDVLAGRFDRATNRASCLAEGLKAISGGQGLGALRASTAAAYGNFVLGNRQESLRYVTAILSDLNAVKWAPLTEQIELALELGVVLAELGRLAEASAIVTQAWSAARLAQLDFDMLRLDLINTTLALECNAVSIATNRFREICVTSCTSGSPGLMARAHAYLARALMREDPPRATEIFESARRALELSRHLSSEWVVAKTAQAFARLMLNDVAGAERAARGADDAAATTANHACRGSTLRELARVAHAQGRKRDARRAITAAIDASYAAGKRQQTVQSLELAAKILRQPAYQEEASALNEAIALSGPVLMLRPPRTQCSDPR